MGFLKTLFGGRQLSPEEEKREQEAKKFDLLKYDGVKAMKIGQADYAVRCFIEALKLHDDLEVHDYLSQVYLRQGELDDAMDELRALAVAEPDNVQVLMRMAQVAYMQEDYGTMVEACEQATKKEPENVQAYYLYAQAMQGQQNMVGAVAMLTKAISLQPDYGAAYLMRADVLLKMGDADNADADAQWLLANVEPHEDTLLLKARLEALRGNAGEAVNYYNKVIELNPFSIESFRERGQLKFNMGDKAGAEQDMQTVLELDPQQLADVSGEYSAEGIEQRVKQAYSVANPLGL